MLKDEKRAAGCHYNKRGLSAPYYRRHDARHQSYRRDGSGADRDDGIIRPVGSALKWPSRIFGSFFFFGHVLSADFKSDAIYQVVKIFCRRVIKKN